MIKPKRGLGLVLAWAWCWLSSGLCLGWFRVVGLDWLGGWFVVGVIFHLCLEPPLLSAG